MSPVEIEWMASIEGDHWWYRGPRDVIRRIPWGSSAYAVASKP